MKYKFVVLAAIALFPVFALADTQIPHRAKNADLIITLNDKFFYFFGIYPNQATKDDIYKKMEEMNAEVIKAYSEVKYEYNAYRSMNPNDPNINKCGKDLGNPKCERLREAWDKYDYLTKRGVKAYNIEKLAGFDWEPSQ